MHLAPAPTAPGPHHNGHHVPGHSTRRPRHIHPARQVQGTGHRPARGRVPRPGTAPTKTPTPTHPRGQTVARARWGKKGPPTPSGPQHRPAHSAPAKGLSTEGHIVLEGQAQHIITAALYTLAAHEHHWYPTAIRAMPPPPQGPKDPVTFLQIDQLLRRRATPHLHPSGMEIDVASWDTLHASPQTSRRPHPQSGRPTGHTGSSWQPRATAKK